MRRVLKGISLGKWIKRKTQIHAPSLHFRRFNLSLVSCSPAELTSVSIEQHKFQGNQLYLQTVEKGIHLPGVSSKGLLIMLLQLIGLNRHTIKLLLS